MQATKPANSNPTNGTPANKTHPDGVISVQALGSYRGGDAATGHDGNERSEVGSASEVSIDTKSDRVTVNSSCYAHTVDDVEERYDEEKDFTKSKVDRYGFFQDDEDDEPVDSYVGMLQRSLAVDPFVLQFRKFKETSRERKWIKMVNKWDFVNQNRRTKLRRRLIKGIPDSFRSQAWYLGLHGPEAAQLHPDLSKIDVASIPEKTIDEIERDIDRTFPRHEMFYHKNSFGQQSLRRVLQLYAALDPDVGYCQGMGFLAGLFLTYMSEERAFYTFYGLLQLGITPLRTLYLPNMQAIQCKLYTFQILCEKYLPELWEHLKSCGIHPTMFATEWLMTLFSRGFSFDLVSRVIDIFCFKGYKSIYRVALAILKTISEQLMSATFEQVLKVLRASPTLVDAESVIKTSFTFKLTSKEISDIESQFDPATYMQSVS